ncbi:alpha-L-fucosidase [Murinocardiopsis flavida]|uniref:alpha-L-fucosidase n=1 Tax=Murinocardiopsis flavida TaxID=645275 RepID=A0A2P8DFE1_9ACTN|nr:alpha-L-fucosidase [Murinocardiopsis flavida]PSK95932.1 alpha-L-fucosidase [Murinocardiopsis flavida]
MAMFTTDPTRPAQFAKFAREVPAWYRSAKFGIFIHWGAYSVPAWAEPIGELGTIEKTTWFRHNPYAEWYANTIRIEGSPARAHQDEVYGGAPYDAFLDQWGAEEFDADEMVALFARTGARYVIPTTKHHDGITLWDAPGTGERNTVHRGPRRDLIGEFARATRAAGLRFGVYYSGGLDWHFADLPPIEREDATGKERPVDAAFHAYAYRHVADLIDRYRPDVLWNDIEWPDAGKPAGPGSLVELFERYYAAVPDGVVNDRWGMTHWDFRTSEYQQGLDAEKTDMWENTRGIGLSFGYNRVEDERHYLDGPGVLRHLVDVVSRGGNLLLNVGPDAAGRLPAQQRAALEQVAAWMAVNGEAVLDSTVLPAETAAASDAPWVRWTRSGERATAFADGRGTVDLGADTGALDPASARTPGGTPVAARSEGGRIVVDLPEGGPAGPAAVGFALT